MRRFSLILCIVVYYAKYDAEEPLLFIISTTIIQSGSILKVVLFFCDVKR